MAYEQRQQAALSDALAWVEDELRETKAQVARLAQGLDQAGNRIGELSTHVDRAHAGSSALSARVDGVPALVQQLAQIRDHLAEVEERATSAGRQSGEGLRLVQVELARLRQELNGAERRIEQLERTIDEWGGRFTLLEEMDRRQQEAVTLLRHRLEETERLHEAAEARAARAIETSKRYDNELNRLTLELERLRKQGESVAERNQVYGEMFKRVEERTGAVEAEVTAQHEIFERLDLLRAELHRVEDRLAGADLTAGEHGGRLDDYQRRLTLLDGKDRGLAERLGGLQGDLATYRAQIAEQFSHLHQALDRQKRRQIEDLERDVRELKTTAFRPLGEDAPD